MLNSNNFCTINLDTLFKIQGFQYQLHYKVLHKCIIILQYNV